MVWGVWVKWDVFNLSGFSEGLNKFYPLVLAAFIAVFHKNFRLMACEIYWEIFLILSFISDQE